MESQQQRLLGLVLTILSALVFIYGAFYHHAGGAATGNAFNAPLWLGVLGMLSGGVLLMLGSRAAIPPP